MDQLKTAIREKGIAVEELRQYSYDTNRNQTDIKNTKTGEDQTYVYDAENRLSQVSVTKDGKTAVIQQNIYNPEDGRFLTEDTYHGENDKPDTQHLYVYCSELCGS